MKDRMTSFDVAAIVGELKDTIVGSFISNVYQVGPPLFLLNVRKPGMPRRQLLIEVGRRMHLTAHLVEKPKSPTDLCMALRKHISGGKMASIEQREFGRTVTITINTSRGVYRLIVELFDKGNLILVSPDNVILQALRYRRMRDRRILRGETFKYPPIAGKNPLTITADEFKKLTEESGDSVVKVLARNLSLGGLYAESSLRSVGIDKTMPSNSLTQEQVRLLYREIRRLALIVSKRKFSPRVVIDEKGLPIDVVPLPIAAYEGMKTKSYGSFNEAADDYLSKTAAGREKEVLEERIRLRLEKDRSVLERQKRDLKNWRELEERNRQIGDLISSHPDLQLLIDLTVKGRKSGSTWKAIASQFAAKRERPFVYFSSFSPRKYEIEVQIGEERFSLSPKRSIYENAELFYKKARKAKRKAQGVLRAMEKTRDRIGRVEEEIKALPTPRVEKLRKKAWYEKFRWFHSSNSFLVIGGRDAKSNESLIKRYTDTDDIVFHADIVGAPFVTVKTEGKRVPEQTKVEAAKAAASYSRAWKESLGAIDVYYVRPEQLSKRPPTGQYIPTGAFVIRGKKSYAKGVGLGLAIGVKVEEGNVVVLGGPKSAVKTHTPIFVEIAPGGLASGELARRVRVALAKKAPEELSKKIASTRLETIQSFIPAGKGRIIR